MIDQDRMIFADLSVNSEPILTKVDLNAILHTITTYYSVLLGFFKKNIVFAKFHEDLLRIDREISENHAILDSF